MKGRVKWWSKENGYGFIEYNEKENIFAHIKNEEKNNYSIFENQEIEFTIEEENNCVYLHVLKTLKN